MAENQSPLVSAEERAKATAPLTVEHVNKRVAEAKAALAKLPPPPLQSGDWAGVFRTLNSLASRLDALEGKGATK